MSAYSASRHLAVELESFELEMRWFVAELGEAVRASALPNLVAGPEGETDPPRVGAVLCVLLERLRGDENPRAVALRSQVHRLIARLLDREVDLLEEGLARR
jgi:hypothetical protein